MQIKLLVRDTKREAKTGIAEVLKIYKHCVGFISSESSGPTIEISKILSVPIIDRAIISCTSTSPALSAKEFSNFVRTCASDAVQAKLMVKMMKGLFVA